MADYTITFGPLLAVDPSQSYEPAKNATGSIYSATDTSTALSVTDVGTGNTIGTDVLSNDDGLINKGQVTVSADDPSDLVLVWISGNYTVTIESITAITVYLDAKVDALTQTAEDARDDAAGSAQSALNSAQAAQAAADTASAPANDAINDHLGGDATDLVPRVTALEDSGTGGGTGQTWTVWKRNGVWPTGYGSDGAPDYTGGAADAGVRPTDDADVTVRWVGKDPSPAIVASGTGGMLSGSDERGIYS